MQQNWLTFADDQRKTTITVFLCIGILSGSENKRTLSLSGGPFLYLLIRYLNRYDIGQSQRGIIQSKMCIQLSYKYLYYL